MNEKKSAIVNLASLAVILAAFFAYNLVNALECRQPIICIDGYWAQFWLITYSDGFTRRAFLGSTIQSILGSEFSASQLNLVCLLIIVVCISLLLISLVKKQSCWRNLLPVAFLVGPTTTVLFETMGDPLHVVIIIVAVLAILPSKSAMIAAPFSIPIVVLIHEASIFLFVPAAILIVSKKIGRQVGAWHLLVSVVALTLASLAFSSQGHSIASGNILTVDGTFLVKSQNLLPGFWELAEIEIGKYLEFPSGPVLFLRNLAGAWMWPFLFLIAWSAFLRNSEPLRIFLLLLLLSCPLYIIAHDWGRFAIYTMYSTILVTALGASVRLGGFLEAIFVVAEKPFVWLRCRAGFEFCTAMLFAFEAHRTYRIEGLKFENMVILTVLFAILVFGQKILDPYNTKNL